MAALLRRAGLLERMDSDRLQGYARNPRLKRLGKGNASVFPFDPTARPVSIGATRYAEKIVTPKKNAAREIIALMDLKGINGVIALESYNLNYADGSAQLVMPRMVGTLSDVFTIGNLGHLELAYALQKVLETLDGIHLKHWAHLDLKGANVLVDEDANLWISDFDLARKFGGDIDAGTPGHRAPEYFFNKGLEDDVRLATGDTDKYLIGTMCIELLLDEPLPAGRAGNEIELGRYIYQELGDHDSVVRYLRESPRFARLFTGDGRVVEQFQRFLEVAMKKRMEDRGNLKGEEFVTRNAPAGREGFVSAVTLQRKLIVAEEMKQFFKSYEADFLTEWNARRALGMRLVERPPAIETKRDSGDEGNDAVMQESEYARRTLNAVQNAAMADVAEARQPPREPVGGGRQNELIRTAQGQLNAHPDPPAAPPAEQLQTAVALVEEDEMALAAARALSEEMVRTGYEYTAEQFLRRMANGGFQCAFPLPHIVDGQMTSRPCGKFDRDRHNALTHIRGSHVKQPLVECPQCRSWFPTAQHYRSHQLRCLGEQPNA